MALSISNTVQSPNPLQGLLGLNPKPLAQPASNIFGGQQTTTPGVVSAPATNFNFANAAPLPTFQQNSNGSFGPASVNFGAINLNPGQTQPQVQSTPVQQVAQPQNNAAASGTVSLAPTATPAGTANGAASLGTTQGLFPSVLSSIQGIAQNQQGLGQQATQIAQDYGKEIADSGTAYQKAAAGDVTSGTTPVAEGNQNVALNTAANLTNSLTNAGNFALSGVQQAQNANTAASTALGTVAGLAQPSQAAFGQTTFDPTTGTYSGGTSGGLPADVMQQYAQMAVNGNYSAIPSSITSNPVLNAQLNVAAQALNPNYEPVTASGASTVLAGIPALQSANTAATGISNTVQTYLQQNPDINPSSLAVGNTLQQWIQGQQLTDPRYQTLFNYLNEYTNTLAPILGVGGDATNLKTEIAQNMVNAAASGQSISQVLNAINQLATNKVNDLANGATGGSTSVPAPSTGADTWDTLSY